MTAEIHRRLVALASRSNRRLATDLERLPTLAIPPRPDLGLAEYLARAVTGQQLSTKVARTIWGRVLAAAAASQNRPLIDLFTPENEAALRACGLSGSKVKTILGIAQAAKSPDWPDLLHMDHEGRSQRLTQLWGIGQWTCDMAGIFYFNDPDIWPRGDLACGATLRKYLRPATDPHQAADRFKPYRSYLAFAMWRLLDSVPAEDKIPAS